MDFQKIIDFFVKIALFLEVKIWSFFRGKNGPFFGREKVTFFEPPKCCVFRVKKRLLWPFFGEKVGGAIFCPFSGSEIPKIFDNSDFGPPHFAVFWGYVKNRKIACPESAAFFSQKGGTLLKWPFFVSKSQKSSKKGLFQAPFWISVFRPLFSPKLTLFWSQKGSFFGAKNCHFFRVEKGPFLAPFLECQKRG